MREYLAIPQDKIRVATLGVNTADLAPGSSARHDPFTIGYFARVAPEKGLHNLAEAYRILRHEKSLPPSRLVAGGYLAPEHRGYFDSIAGTLRECGPRR